VKIGNLNSLKKNISDHNLIEENKTNKQPVSNHKALYPLKSNEAAIAFFKEITPLLINKNKKVVAAYLGNPLLSVQNGDVTFTISSIFVQESIESEWRHIKNEAQKRGIELKGCKFIHNAEKLAEYNPVTPQQQFEVLTKKYPLLQELKERFDLYID
jgi:hypothetical protein